MVSVCKLDPGTLLSLEPQASQSLTCGVDTRSMEIEEAEMLCEQVEAWAVHSDGRLIGAFGINETFPGTQGVCWAILADGIGTAHLAMTRFARSRVVGSRLKRIEAIVRGPDAENVIDQFPGLDNGQLLAAMMATPTPECVWARLCGLRPAHVLRKMGALAETHILFERIS